MEIPPFPSHEELALPLMARIFDSLFHSFPMLIYQTLIFTIAVEPDARTDDLKRKFILSITFTLCDIFLTLCILFKKSKEHYFKSVTAYVLEMFAGGLSFIPNLKAVESGHSRVINMVGIFLDPVIVFDILKAIAGRKKELTFIFSHDSFSKKHTKLYEYFWNKISEKAQIVYFFKFKVHKDFIRWFAAHDLDGNGTLSKDEFEDIFRWWERIAGFGVDIPLPPLRYAIFREDIVLTEFYVHPYEMNWTQAAQFPVVHGIFQNIYQNALKGIPEKEREHIKKVEPNGEITNLSVERSISLITKKDQWTRMKVSHSKIHLSFIIEYRLVRKLILHECHISTKGMGIFEHRLRELKIDHCFFSKLSALNNFKKLEVLEMNSIEDLSVDCEFVDLPALRVLTMAGNGINFKRLSVLQHLTRLEKLILRDCDSLHTRGIYDPFYFPVLEQLNLSGSKFDRLDLLDGGLPNLKILNLKRCQHLTTDMLDYLHLPALEQLQLSESNFDRMKVLASLSSLKCLHLQHCKCLEVDPKEPLYFPELVELDLSGSPFDQLKVISDLPKLQRLYLMRCEHLGKDEGAAERLDLPSLQVLDVRSSAFKHLSLLNNLPVVHLKLARCENLSSDHCTELNLPNLMRLELYGTNFDQLSLLQGIQSLENIDLEACQHLTTVGCEVLTLQNLTEMNLSRSSFDNLALLAELPVLKRLNLEECQKLVCKPGHKLFLPEVRWLCLSKSSFTLIANLNGLRKLRELYLSGCENLSTIGVDSLMWPSLQELDLSSSNFHRVDLITNLPSLKVLNFNECQNLNADELEVKLRLPNLEEFHISGSNFTNLSLLSEAHMLESLTMEGSRRSIVYKKRMPETRTQPVDGESKLDTSTSTRPTDDYSSS